MQILRRRLGLLVLAIALMGATTMAEAQKIEDITVMNGARAVPATVVVPDGAGPFPAVVMNHGHGGGRQEGGGFAKLAGALADAGIMTIRMDFPGTGDSKAPFTDGYLSNMISDSNASLAYLLANYPADKNKLGILGYSMGGRIALTIAATADNPYKAVGLLAPSSDPGKTLALFFAGSEAEFERLYAEASTDKGYADYTTIYGQKQQLGKRWFDELLASHPDETIGAYKGPMLIVHGDKDTVIKQPEVDALIKAYPAAQLVTVPGADHGYGFYSDQPDVTALVQGSFAKFFSENLK
jgi:dienelactone hydrolase